MSIDLEKLRQAQQAEFGPYFEYLPDPEKQPPPSESKTSMSYSSENGGLLYSFYLPGHLRKRSTFRDQLVIPSACILMVLYACHDHAMSGGHLAYKHTFDKVRDRFWWPTLHNEVKTRCHDCQACQRRKSPHRQNVAKALVERVFDISGPPETLHSDKGLEFENKGAKQPQNVSGYKKTKMTPYRLQGNSVSVRVHSTLHAMLSM